MLVYQVDTNSIDDLVTAINSIKRTAKVTNWCVTRDWDSDQRDGGVIAFFDAGGQRRAEIREGQVKRKP